jgi:hypothetical protein
MGGDTDRTRCRLGRVRMLMRGECYCRPKGQHNAQARYPLRYRPHDGYPMEAFFESIPKRHTNATREYVDGYVSSTVATPTLHENSTSWNPKRSLNSVRFRQVQLSAAQPVVFCVSWPPVLMVM